MLPSFCSFTLTWYSLEFQFLFFSLFFLISLCVTLFLMASNGTYIFMVFKDVYSVPIFLELHVFLFFICLLNKNILDTWYFKLGYFFLSLPSTHSPLNHIHRHYFKVFTLESLEPSSFLTLSLL